MILSFDLFNEIGRLIGWSNIIVNLINFNMFNTVVWLFLLFPAGQMFL